MGTLLKVILLALKPFSKTADIWDYKDIINLLINAGGWGGGTWMSNNFGWFNLYHLLIFPAILFFVAAVKMQFKLDSYEKKLPKFEYRLLPFPQSGARIMREDEDELQEGYAQIAIANKGGKVDDCIGTICGIAAVSNLKGKLIINPLIFINEGLCWYGNNERITIPNDKVERFLNLAFIDQHNPGIWQLAIKGNQKKDYGVGWWKIDVVISSLSTQIEPFRVEIALGLGDREYPASGINLWPWHKWYKTRQEEMQQASHKESSQTE